MNSTLLVFLGAGVGGALRHGVNVGCTRWCGPAFPVGTVLINILGSFAMGLVAGWFAFRTDASASQALRLFLTTGILGGFTTFSAFSLDAALLWERGALALAGFYVIGSVVLSLAALGAALAMMRALP
jgi:CrcB protein